MKWTSFLGRLKSLREKSEDDSERASALAQLVKFFLLVLALTILSRGLARASEARVEVGYLSRQTIVHSQTVAGSIVVPEQWTMMVPGELLVSALPVAPGDSVEKGAVLVYFDEAEMDKHIVRTEAQLQKLQVQYESLLDPVDVSEYSLAVAQNSLTQAQKNLQDAEEDKLDAESDLQQASTSLGKAKRELEELMKLPPEQQNTETLQKVQEQVTALEAEVQQAEARLASALATYASAQYAVSNASAQLEETRRNYQSAVQQASWTEEQNEASAQLTQLEIDEMMTRLAELKSLKADGCCIRTEEAGVVKSIPLSEGGYTTGTECVSVSVLHEGVYVEFSMEEEGEQTFSGNMTIQVSQENITERTHLLREYIISMEDGEIRFRVPVSGTEWSSQQVKIQMEQSRVTSDQCVPLSALHADAHGYFVYILEKERSIWGTNNLAVRVDVMLVDVDGIYAAITGDVTNRDTVITSSNKPLSDGDRVQVAP